MPDGVESLRPRPIPAVRQLSRFLVVGAVGYGLNLALFDLLIADLAVRVDFAAMAAFVVALLNNHTFNRRWTFAATSQPYTYQLLRFAMVSGIALGGSVVILDYLVGHGAPPLGAQAAAIGAVTPLTFVANKYWSFR